MTEIEELKKRIESLPKGYVTHRNVNGTRYYYHQGTSGGKQYSFRINEEEVREIEEKIEERKILEQQLRLLKSSLSSSFSNDLKLPLSTNYSTGALLRYFADTSLKYQERDCIGRAREYLYGETEDKVCIIYGLRRTGKTTILKQLISKLSDEMFSSAIYIKCRTTDTIATLNKDMITLRDYGFRYVFIDEVTLLEDFIDSSSLFSDVYASHGMKIVLSGTDSLGFHFAVNDELYDRAVMVHTTYIPFREHSRLLGIDDTDEYIRYGGTLKAGEWDFESEDVNAVDASFRDDENTRHYIDTSICSNIQHSLECFKGGRFFRHLRQLHDKGELTNAIQRIVEDMNHSFAVEVITRRFKSHDLGSAAQLLRSSRNPEERMTVLDEIDSSMVIGTLKRILSIKEKEEQAIGISDVHVEEIKEYLKILGLLDSISIEHRFADNPSLNSSEIRYIFSQPGMRYAQAETLVYSLMKDPQLDMLEVEKKSAIGEKIRSDVIGRMLEDIVLLDTKKSLLKKRRNKKEVFKLQFADGEFDMVVSDPEEMTCRIYEVKHSKERFERQYQHMINSEKLRITARSYGKILSRTVLYKGENFLEENGIEYKNVEEYLKNLD